MADTMTLKYGELNILYSINIDPKRTTKIAIHVEPDGSVCVDAPEQHDRSQISKAVHKRARWVAKHVEEAQQRYKHVRTKQYVSGEEILYLGRRYMLRVELHERPKRIARLKGNKLIVEVKNIDPARIRAIVKAWMTERSRVYFSKMITEKSDILPWIEDVPAFKLQKMTRQWGSCTPDGSIILNPHLIKAPRPCIEYVVLHELTHIKHHDHSPEFFNLIDKTLPNWKIHKGVLDNMVEILYAE